MPNKRAVLYRHRPKKPVLYHHSPKKPRSPRRGKVMYYYGFESVEPYSYW